MSVGSFSEHKQEVGQSPSKKSSKTSTAKKKRKPQQSVLDTKPSVGVHGADLFLQARLAAEVSHPSLLTNTVTLVIIHKILLTLRYSTH